MSKHLTKAREGLAEIGTELEFILKTCEYNKNEVPIDTLVLVLLKSVAIVSNAASEISRAVDDLEHAIDLHSTAIEALEETLEGEEG